MCFYIVRSMFCFVCLFAPLALDYRFIVDSRMGYEQRTRIATRSYETLLIGESE